MFSYSNSFHVIIQTPEVPYGKTQRVDCTSTCVAQITYLKFQIKTMLYIYVSDDYNKLCNVHETSI